ncbi:hypothetical protein BsWGS_20103 [Bradybaena similaris]
MFCGVLLWSCCSTPADKSLSIIIFNIIMFTIIVQAITTVNCTVTSNFHKESLSNAPGNSAGWASESIVTGESERTNIPTFIRARSPISFHGVSSSVSHSKGSTVDLLESNGRWSADRPPETPTVQQYGILAEVHSRTNAVFNAELLSHPVQVGTLSTASEFSNPNGLRQRLDSGSAVNEVNNNKVTTGYYNSNVKYFVRQHFTKPSMDTSSGDHSAYVTPLGKSINSDYDATSVDTSVVRDSVSKKLDASWKNVIVMLIEALITAVQIRFAASSQAPETPFDVHSPAKPPPESKLLPEKPINTLPKRTKRSNVPEFLYEDNQSSMLAVAKPNESIITPSSFDILPVSTASPLDNPPSLIHKVQSEKIDFNSQKVVTHPPENFGRSFETLDIRNKNPFINTSKEQDLMTWFGGVSPLLRTAEVNSSASNTSSLVYDNKTALALVAPDGHIPCNDNCSRSQGVCVMGSDFKPHCVVVADACDHFPCVNGDCVATDGLYKCECHAGWVGPFCDRPCALECGDNGYCGSFDHNTTVTCICHWNYTGHRCQDKRQILHSVMEAPLSDNDLEVWEIAVVVTMISAFLALFCVLMPYLLWRRQWVPIRKFIFYFQQYEDDDEKQYDAFISYKSTPKDEKFILQHLYPKLEKELHFKLCLHFRDFPPGEPIANNIIRAIEGSRRTILILSPSFVSSEWCRMEYQKAQYEMLKLKHKIIPIILEDISGMPEIDRNLQNIMDTVTYITWPGNEESTSSKRLAKFWTLLELSMPKRKAEYHRCSTASCTSATPTNGDCTLSSTSEEDPPAGSSSSDDRSVSENSISSVDYWEMSKESSCSSTDDSYCQNILQDSVKDNCLNYVIDNPGSCREEAVNVNSGMEEDEKETNLTMSAFDEAVKEIVKQRETSVRDCERTGGLGHQAAGTPETFKGNSECSGKEQTTVFFSSDDYIVEIREVGRNGVRINPRPRQTFV